MKKTSLPLYKGVEYAYPTSPSATRLGYSEGCYTVTLGARSAPAKAISGHASREAAVAAAEALPQDWHPIYLLARQMETRTTGTY